MREASRPVDRLLTLEWWAVFLAAILGFFFAGGPWWLFLLLILAPDISMLGYLAGPRVGAAAYNLFHVLIWPLALLGVGVAADILPAVQIGCVWMAHIAFDRALGYGLKLPGGFQETHLGRIGRTTISP